MKKVCHYIRQQVKEFIEEEALLRPGEKLLVALSGGADSVALLHILQSLGYQCQAAHCNFHLRGDESDRDEVFVRNLCQASGITLHVVHFDTCAYAASHKVSIEMAARQLRYDWFGQLCEEHGLDHVAVAHHRDDSVETVLLNLVRGTGIAGLTGIRPRNGRVVRPLLKLGREDILAYLKMVGQTYVTDSTNLQDEFLRNKIRLRLLPLMAEMNPSVKEGIAAMTQRLAKVERIYNDVMAEAASRVFDEGRRVIHIPSLLAEKEPENLLFELLHPYGFTASQIKDIFHCLSGVSGRRFVCARWIVLKDRDQLLIQERVACPSENEWLIEDAPAEIGMSDGSRLEVRRVSLVPDYQISRLPQVASLDASKVVWPLTVRRWRAGDKFSPFGMRGKKLVSDFLTDCKLSLFEKEKQLVVCDACGHILWVVGLRSDERTRLTGTSAEVIELEWFKA